MEWEVSCVACVWALSGFERTMEVINGSGVGPSAVLVVVDIERARGFRGRLIRGLLIGGDFGWSYCTCIGVLTPGLAVRVTEPPAAAMH